MGYDYGGHLFIPMASKGTKLFKGDRGKNKEGGPKARMDSLECVSSRTIRRPKWILRQFKEETRRLSSAKSSFVTQKWRSDARNCVLRNF